MNVEVIGEVFNIFNAINPAFNVGAASSAAVFTGTLANHTREHGVHEAERVCRGQRSARAARRAGGLPDYVLGYSSERSTGRRGQRRGALFL